MLLSSLLPYVSLLSLSSAFVLPRDVPSGAINGDLKTIDTDVNKYTSAVNSWNGQVLTATAVSNAEQQVESDLKSANSDAQAADNSSASDAQTVIDFFNNTLEPDVKKLVTALIKKKSSFQSAGLAGIAGSNKNLKAGFDNLIDTLASKAPASRQPGFQTVKQKIDQDFDSYGS